MGQVLGDLFGGMMGSDQAMTGYNYLTGADQGFVNNGQAANSQIAALLGLGGNSAAAGNAFKNYLNSTGYQTVLGQGQNAITSNAASRGLVNSGASGKALTAFGQGLAGQYFNNYLGQLSGLQNAGLEGAGQIGQAGTQGGIAGGEMLGSGIAGAGGAFGNGLGGLLGMFL